MTDTGAASTRRLPVFALLAANALSMTGNALTFIAIPWFVLQTTGSASQTGLTVGASFLAAVLAGFLGGPIVDRLGFKTSSIVADLASGASVAGIPLLYNTVGLAFWQLLVLVFMGSLLDAPGYTARQSLVPSLSRRAGMTMERTNSAFQAVQRLALLVGPPLGGVLIAAFGASNVLLFDAASFALSAAIVSAFVPSSASRVSRQQDESGGYLRELLEGLRFLRGMPLVLSLVAGGIVLNFFAEPVYAVVLPVFAERVFGDAVSFGMLIGGYGGGSLAGALLFGLSGHRLPRRTTLTITIALSALPFVFLTMTDSLPLGVALMFVQGLALGAVNPLVFTVIHERVPERLLGRVFGVFIALVQGAAPLGILLSGYAVEAFGVRAVLLAIAAGIFAVSLYTLLNASFGEMERVDKQASRPEQEID